MRLCTYTSCSFPVFGTDRKTGKGYCKSHQYLRTDTDKRSISQKGRDKGTKRTYESPRQGMFVREEPIEKVEEKKEWILTLDEWFQKIEDKHWGKFDTEDNNDLDFFEPIEVACMECGTLISRVYARHATAHLLPKKIFKSVATNDLNYLILGAGCGCHDKTHRIDKFVQMKVWPIAAKQINALLPLLPYDELKFVSQQLYDALEGY